MVQAQWVKDLVCRSSCCLGGNCRKDLTPGPELRVPRGGQKEGGGGQKNRDLWPRSQRQALNGSSTHRHTDGRSKCGETVLGITQALGHRRQEAQAPRVQPCVGSMPAAHSEGDNDAGAGAFLGTGRGPQVASLAVRGGHSSTFAPGGGQWALWPLH